MTNITIIITTFNSEKTILRTINSILSQDGIGNDFHVELIVVDDCSSDDTLKVLYKSKWVNLRKKTKKSSKKYDDSKGFICEGINGREALVHS